MSSALRIMIRVPIFARAKKTGRRPAGRWGTLIMIDNKFCIVIFLLIMNLRFLFLRVHTHVVYFLLRWSIDLIKLMFTWLINLVDWMLNRIVLVSCSRLYYLWLVTNRCKLLLFIFMHMLTLLLLSNFDYILFLTFL